MAHPHLTSRFIPIWKEAPALRLLLPLIPGIIVQWYLPLPIAFLLLLGLACFAGLVIFLAKTTFRFYFSITLQLLLVVVGALLLWLNDARHHPSFIGRQYRDSTVILATLQEPLIEKQHSYKAEATIQVLQKGQLIATKGRIILYLKKEAIPPPLAYGSQLVFCKPLQPIRNAGNPGSFNYERHSLFHHLFYQVFLSPSEYVIQPQKRVNAFRQHLFTARQTVISVFKTYIPGKTASGMAEALLIGYRNDLDRDLVQRYSNTGVVHIIAISGMHLGLIYWLVVLPFRLFKKSNRLLVLQALSVLAVLWFFSFLTGASPSILRSAVMFSFIALGQVGQQRSSIYNNLALSALLILLFDPFSLWDVGFQLSYAALLSIVIFSKPISNGFYVKHKPVRQVWQLVAVTIAAQILTYPLVAYHFHQFPTLFLLTNLIAVPLSTGLIFALLALLLMTFFPPVANSIGLVIQFSIRCLNRFIDWVDRIPFSLIDYLSFTIPEVAVVFLAIAAAGWWLLRRSPAGLVAALSGIALFLLSYTGRFVQQCHQRKLIVYHVPQHAAIDVVAGRQYLFWGDEALQEEGFLQHFHLKPSRVLHQVRLAHTLPNVKITSAALQAGNTKLVIVRNNLPLPDTAVMAPHIVVLSGNPDIRLEEVNKVFHASVIVADATNKYYRIKRWQQEAVRLHLRFHTVAEDGAFVQEWK